MASEGGSGAVAATAATGAPPASEAEQVAQSVAGGLRSCLMMVFLVVIATNLLGGSKSGGGGGVDGMVNFYEPSTPFEITVLISPLAATDKVFRLAKEAGFETMDELIVWRVPGLTYDYAETNARGVNLTVPVGEALLSGSKYYAHVFVCRDGAPLSLSRVGPCFNDKHPIVTRGPPPKADETVSLLGLGAADRAPQLSIDGGSSDDGEASKGARYEGRHGTQKEEEEEEEEEEGGHGGIDAEFSTGDPGGAYDRYDVALHHPETADEEDPEAGFISYWTPALTLSVVVDQNAYPQTGAPEPLGSALRKVTARAAYYPIIYFNEFWVMSEHRIPVNDTLAHVPLELATETIGVFKWQLYASMAQSLATQESMGAGEGGVDELKHMLMDSNPWLLGLTGVVTVLHTVFEFLAFKNDIHFWKNNKSMAGLSVRGLFVNFGSSVIIFLYLLDNETSWMIIGSCGVGLAIEAWKITKAVHVTVDWSTRWKLVFTDKESYKETKRHDDAAYRFMSYLLFPLVFGYSLYSLIHDTHRGWYSYVLNTAVGAVYTFGFVTMTPQLFINYKLKSVAHLPWRAFTYKFFCTIIDDCYSWIIRMPTMHRISVYRDDLVFLVMLYQRWIYRVDPNRKNEYGTSLAQIQEWEEQQAKKKQGSADVADTATPGGDTQG